MNDACNTCGTTYRIDRFDEQRWRHLCLCELGKRLRCGKCKTLATHYLLGVDGSPDRPSCSDHGVPEEDVGTITHPEPEAAPTKTRSVAKTSSTAPSPARSTPRFQSLEVFAAEVRKNDYHVLCKHCRDEHRHGDRVCIVDDYGAFDTRCPKCRKAGYYAALTSTPPGVTQGLPHDEARCMFCGARAREQPR